MRNGFRVGLGGPGTWPPIQAILNAAGPEQIVTGEFFLDPFRSMPIKLSPRPADQTICFFLPGASLSGAEFPNSSNYWLLRHAIDPDDTDAVLLEFTPEVRQEREGFEWRRTDEGLQQVSVYRGWVGHELACRVAVPPRHYVVIGPSANVSRKGLIGRSFFVRQWDGQLFETLLVFVPEIVEQSASGVQAG
jgi:hypothetical protein